MYEERSYRKIARPRELLCYEVRYKETDLLCCTTTDMKQRIEERTQFYRYQLEGYIGMRQAFRDSLVPVEDDIFAPPIAREMIKTAGLLGIGPMATVAGAMAEFVGNDIAGDTEEFIIENGGDIYLRTGKERISLIYAKDSPFSEKIGIKLKPHREPYGVCTSSATVGPSLSLGKADAVCVIARSSLFADGLATFVGNRVKKKDDIAPAIEKGSFFSGVRGILIVMGEHLGAWGDIEIVKMRGGK
jgi:ApbE superfamily uncharacterized protein (UPF0280 family)